MKKIFTKEVIIGLLVVIALAILFMGIDFLKGMNLLKKENTYYISFENVAGLAVSAPVTVNGYKVGLVREIAYEYDNPGHVRVDIDIDDEMKLPEGTIAYLESDLLGTASISLQLGKSSSMMKAGSEIPGHIPAGMMDMVSNELLPSVSGVFPKVDTLLTNINTLVADPALRESVQRLDVLTANLVTATEHLNAVVATLPPITRDAKQITGNFVKTSEDINILTQNLNTLTQNINEMPLDSVINSLQLTLDNLHSITAELEKGMASDDSTLGKLMNDPALYNNLNHSIQSLDSLFIDIKQNPKRYISIKLL